MPTFLKVFEFAAEEGLLHPEFVAFFRPLIDGQSLSDPATPGLDPPLAGGSLPARARTSGWRSI